MNDEASLIARVRSGDAAAWRVFVETYSPIIRKTIKRYVKDPETESNLYASLLGKLADGKLARFESRSSISTWLFAVARNHCRDHFRGEKGIRHLSMAVEGLGPLERRFFILYYVQGLSLGATYAGLRAEMGSAISYLDLFDCREKIAKAIKRKKLGRIIDRLLRPDAPALDFAAADAHHAIDRAMPDESPSASPDAYLDAKNLQLAIEHLRAAIIGLPDRDQLILKLRFEHKKSAREISEVLSLGNEKQIYRKLDGIFEELRAMLVKRDSPADLYREAAADIETLCRSGSLWRAEGNWSGTPDS